jgi:hypothetical protein
MIFHHRAQSWAAAANFFVCLSRPNECARKVQRSVTLNVVELWIFSAFARAVTNRSFFGAAAVISMQLESQDRE